MRLVAYLVLQLALILPRKKLVALICSFFKPRKGLFIVLDYQVELNYFFGQRNNKKLELIIRMLCIHLVFCITDLFLVIFQVHEIVKNLLSRFIYKQNQALFH